MITLLLCWGALAALFDGGHRSPSPVVAVAVFMLAFVFGRLADTLIRQR